MSPAPKGSSKEERLAVAAEVLRSEGWVCIPPGTDHDHHFVVFDADAWYTEHSIVCRLRGGMAHCGYHTAAAKVADSFEGTGRWWIKGVGTDGRAILAKDRPR